MNFSEQLENPVPNDLDGEYENQRQDQESLYSVSAVSNRKRCMYRQTRDLGHRFDAKAVVCASRKQVNPCFQESHSPHPTMRSSEVAQ